MKLMKLRRVGFVAGITASLKQGKEFLLLRIEKVRFGLNFRCHYLSD